MEFKPLSLHGLLLITPQVHLDARGFFLETYRRSLYAEHGITCPFVQDNHSYSDRGTLRGLHFQTSPGQDKLVRVLSGKIFDVAVDIRPDSPTFGKWEGVYLDGESHHQLFVPVGFAHGFCVVSESAHVLYKVSADYDASTEAGFRWDDPEIGVEWPIDSPLLSERDQQAPSFDEIRGSL